ncbi:ketoacyl-ACP synthase III family protein [Streptomyces sp. BP-8]|uniref:Ketoacyl-ACP synthase III family protein n=1 Tax=Streptomyces sirii TaxID=3127701 RepID=A0ABZ2QV01_9ACTN
MRFGENVTIDAAVCWLPTTRQSAAAQVSDGVLTPAESAQSGVVEVPVAVEHAAPEMAVLAGRRALRQAGVAPADVDVLFHSWTYHQGHDFWSPAHYVADGVGAVNAVPVGIAQMCHGGAMALHEAALHLCADPSARAALVTTGDRFQRPGFDRWTSDSHVAYGDGATAAVLSRSGRGLRLLAQTVRAAPDMEGMYRGDDPFSPAPLEHSRPVDVRRTKKAFAAAGGMARFAELAPGAIGGLITSALAQAGLAPDDRRVRHVLLPRLGPATLERTYLPVLERRLPHATVHRPGAHTGHLGSGDLLANLAVVQREALIAAGEVALLLTGGGGFTWSCTVLGRGTGPDGPAGDGAAPC